MHNSVLPSFIRGKLLSETGYESCYEVKVCCRLVAFGTTVGLRGCRGWSVEGKVQSVNISIR